MQIEQFSIRDKWKPLTYKGRYQNQSSTLNARQKEIQGLHIVKKRKQTIICSSQVTEIINVQHEAKQSNGPIVLFIPGADGTGRSFQPQLPKLQAMGLNVCILSLPPNHQPTWQHLTSSMHTQVTRMLAKSTSTKIVLIAESFGACLALRYARDYPQHVLSLTLVNPATSFKGAYSGLPDLLGRTGVLALAPDAFFSLLTMVLKPLLIDTSACVPEADEVVQQMFAMETMDSSSGARGVQYPAPFHPQSIAAGHRLRLMCDGDVPNSELKTIQTPTLVVCSAQDKLLPSVKEGARLQRVMPKCVRYLLPDSCHCALLETSVDIGVIMEYVNFITTAHAQAAETRQALQEQGGAGAGAGKGVGGGGGGGSGSGQQYGSRSTSTSVQGKSSLNGSTSSANGGITSTSSANGGITSTSSAKGGITSTSSANGGITSTSSANGGITSTSSANGGITSTSSVNVDTSTSTSSTSSVNGAVGKSSSGLNGSVKVGSTKGSTHGARGRKQRGTKRSTGRESQRNGFSEQVDQGSTGSTVKRAQSSTFNSTPVGGKTVKSRHAESTTVERGSGTLLKEGESLSTDDARAYNGAVRSSAKQVHSVRDECTNGVSTGGTSYARDDQGSISDTQAVRISRSSGIRNGAHGQSSTPPKPRASSVNAASTSCAGAGLNTESSPRQANGVTTEAVQQDKAEGSGEPMPLFNTVDDNFDNALGWIGPWRQATKPVLFGTKHLQGLRYTQDQKNKQSVLFVGNHQLYGLYDMPVLIAELYVRGIRVRGLAHPDHWAHPQIPTGAFFESFGAVKATPRQAYRLLKNGESVLLYPGGAREVNKRKSEKYILKWPHTPDFVRLASKLNCIIIPLSAIGADDAYDIIYDSDDIINNPLTNAIATQVCQQLNLNKEEALMPMTAIPGTQIPALVPIPKINQLYFKFGAPIYAKEELPNVKDEEAAMLLYKKVQGVVEQGMQELLDIRQERRGVEGVGGVRDVM